MEVSSVAINELSSAVSRFEATTGSVSTDAIAFAECECTGTCGHSCSGSCQGGCDNTCYTTCSGSGN